MEILKSKISKDHDNATFYTGIVAYGRARTNGKTYVLRSENSGEIAVNGVVLIGEEIEAKAKKFELNDDSLEDHNDDGVSVLVDGWFVISEAKGTDLESILYAEEQDEDRIFGFYSEAIKGFDLFLNKN